MSVFEHIGGMYSHKQDFLCTHCTHIFGGNIIGYPYRKQVEDNDDCAMTQTRRTQSKLSQYKSVIIYDVLQSMIWDKLGCCIIKNIVQPIIDIIL